MNISPICPHRHHLFNHPFCTSQPLLKRIANAVFHLFTFGIPLAFYHIVSCAFSIRARIQYALQERDLRAFAIASVKEHLGKNNFPAREEAFAFAEEVLRMHPSLLSKKWYGSALDECKEQNESYQAAWERNKKRFESLHPPLHSAITCLRGLLVDVYQKSYLEKAKADQEKSQEWVEAAQQCMQLSYVIGCLMLDELSLFIHKYPEYEKRDETGTRDLKNALTIQDSYQYKVFFDCPGIYYSLRCANGVDKESFYTEGTPQHSWRELYNDYCDRIYQLVSEKDLQAGDPRHVLWTGKDEGPESFNQEPGSIPT